MSDQVFIHSKSEATSGYRLQKPDNWKDVTPQARAVFLKQKAQTDKAFFVEGYSPCPICQQHPSFAFDSARPNEIKVIVCQHIAKGGKIKAEFNSKIPQQP